MSGMVVSRAQLLAAIAEERAADKVRADLARLVALAAQRRRRCCSVVGCELHDGPAA